MMITHLTNQLQSELNRIGSGVLLQSELDHPTSAGLGWPNYKEWAWASVADRHFEAHIGDGEHDKHVQLSEGARIVYTSSTLSISEIASIADKWLIKKLDSKELHRAHPGTIEIV